MTDNERIERLNEIVENMKNTIHSSCDVHLFIDDFIATVDLINRQKNEIISRTEEYNDMLEQRNKVEEALEVMTMDVNSLTSERDALNEMVAEQKAELSKKDTEINILIRKKESLRDEISELKAEVERLQYILMGVMHSVDKWLEGDELKQDEVNRAATMREKTLQIIEKRKAEIKGLTEELKTTRAYIHANGLEWGLMSVAKVIYDTKTEAIKEFAERLSARICDNIEQSDNNPDGDNYFITDVYKTIDNLVKEMTE